MLIRGMQISQGNIARFARIHSCACPQRGYCHATFIGTPTSRYSSTLTSSLESKLHSCSNTDLKERGRNTLLNSMAPCRHSSTVGERSSYRYGSNPFTDRLDIRPIIQAPMAGVSTPQLAAAVSNAGGLGSLGLGGSSIEQARELIEETRSLTTRPFNANFFCHSPAVRHPACEAAWIKHLEPLFTEFGATPPSSLTESYRSFLADEQGMDMLLATRPPVVSFHFGTPPREQIQRLRAAGIYTMATATSVHEAMAIEEAGLDAIIAQGVEAGGHRGIFDPRAHDELLPTAVLVRLLLQRTQLPVVAAGGVMDGAGVRAVMELGAAAAQMGTAFILCPESAANAGYRSNLQSAKAWSTQLTKAISGRPARGLVNRLIVHGEVPGAPPPAAYPLAFDVAKQLNAAATKQGSHEFGAHWAGQGAPLARAMPAAALVEELVEAIER